MIGLIIMLFLYIIAGLIQISVEDKTGETSRKIAELLGKSIKWPVVLYRKYYGV